MIALPASRAQIAHPVHPELPDGLEVRQNTLYYHGIDLMALVEKPINVMGHYEMPVTPMYVRYLPALRHNYRNLIGWFQTAQAITGYPGDFQIAYASKANPSQPVVQTLMREGAAYECSSSYDVEVVRQATKAGWINKDRLILSNGFKIPSYTANLLRLRSEGHTHILPILDDVDEIEPFAESGMTFEIGLRSRTNSAGINRFGMAYDELEYAATKIMATENLRLTTFHAMQTLSAARGLQYHAAMAASLRIYAQLRQVAPTLHRFNLGGGLPASNSGMDFQDWMIQTLQMILNICSEEGIPVPDLMVESGRYMVQTHACKMFKILKTKMADDGVPFYMIDGSIMTNFPDAWALGDSFTVLPVNNWESTFGLARLAGLTCDPDDVYPTRKMGDATIELPINSDGLIVGFFDCGAYQETLGGKHGSKHCLLPEGPDIVIDENEDGAFVCDYERAQDCNDVLSNLGYTCR
jgi:arginine decarboxylase